MTEKAVIDRLEGSKAVILVGTGQDRYVIEKSGLPAGAQPGDWLKVDIRDDHIFTVELDKAETASAEKRITGKLDQLRKR